MNKKLYYFKKACLLLLLLTGVLPAVHGRPAHVATYGLRHVAEEITGVITDENGETMPGVTVKAKNSGTAAQSDKDGKFTIKAAIGDVLVFSFVGYQTREVTIASKNIGRVTLASAAIALDEVVAIGYGKIRKSDLTGSVARFSAKDVDKTPVTSIDQALQGKVSGVQITSSSGAPGAGLSFVVRGGNSLGSNQPLIILDGYPIDLGNGNLTLGASADIGQQPGVNPLAALNPNDIESVEVLKDASSTAIYGSRGANGVVIITTKRGKKGKDQVSLSYRTDVSNIRRKLAVLNTSDFINYANEGALNDGIDSIYKSDVLPGLLGVNNYWQDQIYRTATSNTYQVAASGGDDKGQYYLGADYAGINGIVTNSNYKRGSVRFNYDRKVSSALNVKLSMNASKATSRLGLNSGQTGLVSSNAISGALFFKPLNNGTTTDGESDQTVVDNPITVVNLLKDVTETNLVSSNLTADLKLTKALTARANIGAYNTSSLRQSYSPLGTFTGNQFNGYAFRAQSGRFNYLTEFTLNYAEKFAKHAIDAVAGYTWQKWDQKGMGTSASGFPNDNLNYENFQSAKSPGTTTTQHQQWALGSYLGRINYSFNDRYLLTFSGRADGSTRLAQGHKWSFFPSGAFAWKISEEKFFKDNIKAISSMKLRVSYGLSGNQNIAVGGTQSTLGTDAYVINGAIVKGYTQNNIANPVLGWEVTKALNIGTDISLFDDRLQFTVEAYRKVTNDLLISLPIPANTGFSTYLTNSGSVENRGLEFDFTARVINRPLTWTMTGNISFNRNKMLSLGRLGDNGNIFGPNYLSAGSQLNQPLHIARLGNPVGSFYGYRINGIYQTAEEVAAGPEAASAKPGDYRFVDLNGDNTITADDRQIIGNPNPQYIFGWTNNLAYKKFTFSFFFQGSIGNDIINLNRYRLDALSGNNYNVSQEAYDGRWTGTGTSNTYPRARSVAAYFNTRFSDFIVEDGSYVRLKNVTLGYTLPVKKIHIISNATVFVTATNLLTFTKYTGYDPEVNADYGSGLSQGVDNGTYPQSKTFTAGINIKF
ncbi:MAG: TonB-dependent receptor [Mucilaginibacter sp.]|uniref:SusC/RagA family TonB-linked outer membrane protein n=1 Tax=Mucilaginibacter sp. TaxID=1882438 RepID=UPI00319ED258